MSAVAVCHVHTAWCSENVESDVEPFFPGCQDEFSSPIMMVMVMLFAT